MKEKRHGKGETLILYGERATTIVFQTTSRQARRALVDLGYVPFSANNRSAVFLLPRNALLILPRKEVEKKTSSRMFHVEHCQQHFVKENFP